MSASGIPRHFPKRMVYPLLDFHETLLECLESCERRTCPSLPARGRHDQPPAVTDQTRPGRARNSRGTDPLLRPSPYRSGWVSSGLIRSDLTRGAFDPGAMSPERVEVQP